MVNITINNKNFTLSKKSTVLEVCELTNIKIPHFCHDSRLKSISNCGICKVDINGELKPACSTEVEDGMVIETHNQRVIGERKKVLENILESHPLDCMVCEKSGNCKLQEYSYEYGVKTNFNKATEEIYIDSSNPFFYIDPNKCIACGKCIQICEEQQGYGILELKETKSGKKYAWTKDNKAINETNCVSCGNCVSICPVGALMPKKDIKYRNWEEKKVKTTCSYCGVGCQMYLNVVDNKIVSVDPAMNKANNGMLCVKGKFGYKFVDHKDRLKKPLIKKKGKFEEVSWEEVYGFIKENMNRIYSESGSDAFAGLTSARCSNEENYLFQKMFRTIFKSNSIDHCARL
ncbi:formate dehydrogenase major subunit [Brassicibacter mesophilus]